MNVIASPLSIARSLLLCVMVALLFSPPITSLLELSLYAVMLSSAELRRRFIGAVQQPLGAMALIFWAVVAVGLSYSIAPWNESLAIWFSWRRLLLVLIGLALFDSPEWKKRALWALVIVATACAAASYLGILLDISYYHYESGIVVRNRAMQGMLFVVAAFAASMLMRTAGFARQSFLSIAAVLLVLNTVFITPGRSGYVTLVVLCAAAAFALAQERAIGYARRLLWVATAIAGALLVLALSPTVRDRVELGLTEAQLYDDERVKTTSVRERVIYLRNTLELVAARPFFGYGTGAFRSAYAPLTEGKTGLEAKVAHDPHNQYLAVASEHGVVGLLVFLALLIGAFGQRSSEPYRMLGLGVLAAWCATSLFSSHFSTFAEGRFIWLWLGVCLARE